MARKEVKMRVHEHCLHCGGCLSVCPFLANEFHEPQVIFTDKCTNCRLCEKVCPVGAIYMEGEG